MDRWKTKVAVITAIESKTSSAIAKDLLKNDLVVVGLENRDDKFAELRTKIVTSEPDRFHPMKCNITNEKEVKECFEKIKKDLHGIDIMINSAAVINEGNLITMETEKIKYCIDMNVMGVIHCTRETFKSMQERNVTGHIIFINSTFGHKITPTLNSFNIFGPTKYAMTAMKEVYKNEFKNFGMKIKTTSISLGVRPSHAVPKGILKLRTGQKIMPEDVSNAVVFALSTPSHVQLSELTIESFDSI